MGKDVFDDRQNAVDDVTEVDLYKVIEFNAELPGTSQLNINLMDKNDFRYGLYLLLSSGLFVNCFT